MARRLDFRESLLSEYAAAIAVTATIDQELDGVTQVSDAQPQFPLGWTRYCPITIGSTNVDADLTDFTFILTEETLPSEMFDADGSYPALNGGGDIRFSSDNAGAVPLACDIRSFTTDNDPANGKADIAVKVPSILAASGATIYVWYNRGSITQPLKTADYGQYNAYDSYYDLVWPMQEDPSGSAPQMSDRTRNRYHGASGGTMLSGDSVDGVAGNALDFDGTDDNVVNASPGYSTGFPKTISCSAKPADITGIQYIFSATGYAPSVGQLMIGLNGGTVWYWENNTIRSATTAVGAGDWHRHAITWPAGNQAKYYQDGASDTIDQPVNAWGLSSPIATAGMTGIAGVNHYEGLVDECRISNTERSAAWCKVEYYNLHDQTAVATAGTPRINPIADVAQELDGVTQTAAAAVSVPGTVTQELDGVTQTAAATVSMTATIAQELDGVTQAVSATHTRAPLATVTQELDGVTQTAAATVSMTATITQELDGVTQTAAASSAVPPLATVTQELDGVTQTAAASVVISATIAQELDGVTQVAGVTAGLITITQELDGVTQTATAIVNTEIEASIVQELDGVTQVLAGDQPVSATIDQELDGVTQSSQGYGNLASDEVTATVVQLLDGVTQAAVGAAPFVNEITQELDGVTMTAQGHVYTRTLDVSVHGVDEIEQDVLAIDTVSCETVHQDTIDLEVTV